MFYQAADILSKLQEGTTPQEQGSILITLKNFASNFSICTSSFEKEVAYFAEKAARKNAEVRLAAIDNYINPTLRTTFMTSDLLSVNLVSAEVAKDAVKASKDLPDRVLEKKPLKIPIFLWKRLRGSRRGQASSRCPRSRPRATLQ